MEKLKKLLNYFLYPKTYLIVLTFILTLVAVGADIYILASGAQNVVAYIIYAFSAITFGYSVYIVVRFAPKIKSGIINLINSNIFTKKLAKNYSFRTIIFSFLAIIFNLAFVAFNLVMGISYKSIWYISSAIYYLFLGGLRAYIVIVNNRLSRKNLGTPDEETQIKSYMLCGICLFILELALTAVVTLMVLNQKPTAYSEIFAIVLAAYTTYKITFAIINIVKSAKQENFQIKALRNLGLADAGTSLVSLQMALISTFGGGGLMALNGITGFSACALTIILGIYMISSSVKKLKKLKAN